MALRIACLLLSLLIYVPFCAAQSADSILLNSFSTESGVTVEFSGGELLLQNQDSVDLQLFEKIDDLFRDRTGLVCSPERAFPFSPRLVGQRNYGIENAGAPPRTLHFVSGNLIDDGVMLENNNGILRAVPPVPFRGAFIVRTSGTNDDCVLEFVVGADGRGTLQAVPVEQPSLILEECDDACTLPIDCADDQPIDVVLAEDECDDDCGSPATGDTAAASSTTAVPSGDVVHEMPNPRPGVIFGRAPTLANPGLLFFDFADAVMDLSPDSIQLTGRDSGSPDGTVEPPPPPLPGLIESEDGVRMLPYGGRPVLLGKPDEGGWSGPPLTGEPIAAAPALAPFGSVDPINGGQAATTVEACQQAEPPLKAKVEHLLEAARHLTGAGYDEEAKIFRVEAEAIQNASHRLLAEKRQELERLQREIAELEALTGQYAMIQIDCRIMEFTVPTDCDVDENLSSLLQTGFCAGGGRPCSAGSTAQLPFGGPPSVLARCSTGATSQLLSGDELNRFLHAIGNHSCGTLKTLAEPCIVTTTGRPATLRSGGEFPIMIPVSAEAGEPSAEVQWKNFGLSMQAVPFVLGNGKVRLRLETELSERNLSNAVTLNGNVIPGLTTRRFNNEVEAQFGETVAIACNSMRTDDGVKSLVLLVTVRQVEPAVADSEHD